MNELYNQDYYRNYQPIPYDKTEHWICFFGNMADHIIRVFNPKTVLDAGCAMGYLVSALRERGVEAYGIDISEYAISKVSEDIKPYCAVGSLTDPLPDALPKRYDMLVTIEVLEHLIAADGELAIANLCSLTDCILFSSTSDGNRDKTRINVQKGAYWAKLFAEQSFFNEVTLAPKYIASYAMCFKKGNDVAGQVEKYEHLIRLSEEKYDELLQSSDLGKVTGLQRLYLDTGVGYNEEQVLHLNIDKWTEHFRYFVDMPSNVLRARFDPVEGSACILKNLVFMGSSGNLNVTNINGYGFDEYLLFPTIDPQLEINFEGSGSKHIEISGDIMLLNNSTTLFYAEKIIQIKDKLTVLQSEFLELKRQLLNKEDQIVGLRRRIEEQEDQLDEATALYATIIHSTSWKATEPLRFIVSLIEKIFKSFILGKLIYRGFSYCKKHGLRSTLKRAFSCKTKKVSRFTISKKKRMQQEKHIFSREIKISILVPLYNTPKQFLRELIKSVKGQTYANWELCLADGSDPQHVMSVEKECMSFAQGDSRIIYKRLEQNEGISGNTNRCIEMSTGEYLGLLDHDDLLHPSALYEVAKAICEQNADFIYTDENTFIRTPRDAYCPHFKPDFSPDMLRSQNYICHFTVYARKLLDKVGKYRSEFDGSQDYDMVLRLTEVAKQIIHIPKILYFWRASPNSVAYDVGTKPYAINAAKAALAEQLDRLGMKGSVEGAAFLTDYRIRYELIANPLVSILIPSNDHVSYLRSCIESIVQLSTYKNYEIVIIENGSKNEETFSYYKHLCSEDENIKVIAWNHRFNYSAINNFGFEHTQGEYVILLNNDIVVISPDWIQEMLMFAQRANVGAVGAMLYYPDDTVQHAGVILGVGGVAGHAHKHFRRGDSGYMRRMAITQNLSAVTAACMMVPRKVFKQLNGLDEEFAIAFNDVDFCMRIRQAGYWIVFTPYAELYHYESKSRGLEDNPRKQVRFNKEASRFQQKWEEELKAGDPYYNPNLTLNAENFSVK